MQEDTFADYTVPELKIQLSYPAAWKIDATDLPKADASPLLAIMFKQSKGSRPSVTILVSSSEVSFSSFYFEIL